MKTTRQTRQERDSLAQIWLELQNLVEIEVELGEIGTELVIEAEIYFFFTSLSFIESFV